MTAFSLVVGHNFVHGWKAQHPLGLMFEEKEEEEKEKGVGELGEGEVEWSKSKIKLISRINNK